MGEAHAEREAVIQTSCDYFRAKNGMARATTDAERSAAYWALHSAAKAWRKAVSAWLDEPAVYALESERKDE